MARMEAILSRFFTLNGAEMMRRDIPKIINLMYC
jgi:hypothetical protein